jgi:DNA-binding IclR family transcriptional regulator
MTAGRRSRKTTTYSAPALEKGLDILELLAGAQRGSTLSEVAVALGRTRNEIFRMLSCLEDRGYIARKNGDDRFQLTARMFELAHRHPPTQDLVTAATPIMRELAARSMQSCQVGMHHDGDVLVVAQVDAPGLVGIAMRVGARRELTNSASGLSLLAFQEPHRRNEWLGSAGANRWSAAKKRALARQLERIVRDGYVEHPNPAVKGVLGLSSPICNYLGHAIATLTVTIAELTAPHPSLREVRPWVIASAARITREMGGVPPTTPRRNARVRSRSR